MKIQLTRVSLAVRKGITSLSFCQPSFHQLFLPRPKLSTVLHHPKINVVKSIGGDCSVQRKIAEDRPFICHVLPEDERTESGFTKSEEECIQVEACWGRRDTRCHPSVQATEDRYALQTKGQS